MCVYVRTFHASAFAPNNVWIQLAIMPTQGKTKSDVSQKKDGEGQLVMKMRHYS